MMTHYTKNRSKQFKTIQIGLQHLTLVTNTNYLRHASTKSILSGGFRVQKWFELRNLKLPQRGIPAVREGRWKNEKLATFKMKLESFYSSWKLLVEVEKF